MIRHVAYGLLVAAFAVFAWTGVAGWSRGERFRQDAPELDDEIPLRVGFLVGRSLIQYATKGYPWESVRGETISARRDLPPDPAPISAEELEKRYLALQPGMKLKMPSGTVTWAQYVTALRSELDRYGIPLLTPQPQPQPSLTFEMPDREWPAITAITYAMAKSQSQVAAITTCEGLIIGTMEACNRARQDATLLEARRQVAAENADPRMDVAYRPDLVDASIVAFSRTVETQTGIEVVVDAQIWEKGPGLSWRGEPRKLRDALDELCRKFRWFWRYRDGRVWLLWP